jgi:methylated-DNA-[protein]-cysteine S-methyltransferase
MGHLLLLNRSYSNAPAGGRRQPNGVRKPPAAFGGSAYVSRMTQYALFETSIGWAGLAWSDQGLVGVHLPEPNAERTRRGLRKRFPDAVEHEPSDAVQRTMAAVRGLLRGEKADLSDTPLEIGRVPEFNARVYEIARAIAPGQTLTYGEIAVRLGDRLLARDVGQALGQNPWPIVVPCHRVTAAGGKLGGFSARGGAATKLKLLAIEGAPAAAQGSLFD